MSVDFVDSCSQVTFCKVCKRYTCHKCHMCIWATTVYKGLFYVIEIIVKNMRGTTQREALATQGEKSIPHVKLINNCFSSQRVRSNPAYVLESYWCKLSFLFGFNDLALKTKKLLINLTLLTFFNEPHLKTPVLTVFLALRPGHNPKNALWTP